jgi:chromate reductase
MTTYKIGIIIGSLARESINRKLAGALPGLAPPNLEFAEIAIRDLPLYSYDYDGDFPPVARAFKSAIAAADAVLFVTPEYNRSIPGALKNAIDWASRPVGTNAFAHKPCAIIGTSTGAIRTAVAQQHLRGILAACDCPQMMAPEAYIPFTPDLITADGAITVAATADFLRTFMTAFATFVERDPPATERLTAYHQRR